MIPAVVGIPIKPFGVAKARLAPVFSAPQRSRLGRVIAAHTAHAVAASGADPAIVTGDAGVARWARRNGWEVIAEPAGGGLNGAATAVVTAAAGAPWAVVHADLPTVAPSDLVAVWAALKRGCVLAPSHDGGTSVIAGKRALAFAYGPGSFHRHLHLEPRAAVVCRPGLALDLDTAADFTIAASLPGGAWLRSAVEEPVP